MTAPVPRERITTVRSKSGRVVMQRIQRPDRDDATDTHAASFAKIEWLPASMQEQCQ